MKGKHEHITAFYIETLLLIVSFVLVILMLTNVFGLGKRESSRAQDLTNAVRLAETGAEAFAAAEGPAELADILDEGNVTLASTSSQYPVPPKDRLPAIIFAYYDNDLNPVAEENAAYRLIISWDADQSTASGDSVLAKGTISVRRPGSEEDIYSLDTAVYIQEVQP